MHEQSQSQGGQHMETGSAGTVQWVDSRPQRNDSYDSGKEEGICEG